MSGLFSRLTSAQLIGWVGFVATLGMIGGLFADWAIAAAWLTIISTTLLFYVTTIEAPYVECEWASWITIPSGLIMIMAGAEPVNYFVAVVGPLALLYGLAAQVAPKYPWLDHYLKTTEKQAKSRQRRAARLAQLEAEEAAVHKGFDQDVAA